MLIAHLKETQGKIDFKVLGERIKQANRNKIKPQGLK